MSCPECDIKFPSRKDFVDYCIFQHDAKVRLRKCSQKLDRETLLEQRKEKQSDSMLPAASSTALQPEVEVEVETPPAQQSPESEIRRSSRLKKPTNYGGEESSDEDNSDPNLKKADQAIKEWVAQEDDPANPEYQDHEEVADCLDPEGPPGSPRAPLIMDPDKDDEDLEDIVELITSEDLDFLDNEGNVERPTLEESAAGPSSTSSLPTLNLPST